MSISQDTRSAWLPALSDLVPSSWRTAVRTLRRGAPALLEQARERTDLLMLDVRLPPVARHLVHAGLLRDTGLYDRTYMDWRVRRVEKMLEIYGVEWFAGKRLVELGCGHAEIGAFFAELGADVLCVDGRVRNVNHAKLMNRDVPGLRFEVRDLENDFLSLGQFDLMINFGLLYHLRAADQHLATCFAMSDEIVLESVVCDSLDPYCIIEREERSEVDEEALNGIGSRPSPFYIERLAEEAGFRVDRHFSSDLNSGKFFRYDWCHRDDGAPNDDFVKRRFWRLKRGSLESPSSMTRPS